MVHNTGPLECLPRTLADIRSDLSELDEHGYVVAYNRACQTFNLKLKNVCQQLRAQFSDAAIVYVDIYSIKYALIENASQYGTQMKNTHRNSLFIYSLSLKIILSVIFSPSWGGQDLNTRRQPAADMAVCHTIIMINYAALRLVQLREHCYSWGMQGSHEIRELGWNSLFSNCKFSYRFKSNVCRFL